MSDARPITNITDYVCGSCWNSFSHTDPGVVQGDRLVCPHCGHVLPQDSSAADLAALVRNAPANLAPDSAEFETEAATPANPSPGQGFPELDSASPYGWLPPDIEAPAPRRDGGSSGFMVGEPDDFDFNEATLRPDQNHDDLLALVRTAPMRPLSDSGFVAPARVSSMPGGSKQGSSAPSQTATQQPFVVGEELGVDIDEKTPMDGDARVQAAVAGAPASGQASAGVTVADLDMADLDMADLDMADLDMADLDVAGLEAEARPDDLFELRDWKLKAMGLTYNFHGLDALLNWASNKVGQAMSVSCDGGATWKDFHSFFEGSQAGMSAGKAFEAALEPGAAPPPGAIRAARMTGTFKASPAAPDLQVPRTPGAEPPAAAAPEAAAPRAPVPPIQPPAIALTGSPSRTAPAANGKSLGPATSPSRRTPVAARQAEKEGPSPAKIAVAVAVIALVMAVLLHVQGVFKIPGLH